MVKFVRVTAKTVPWSQRFFLKFFFGKERASSKRQGERETLCLRFAARSLFPEEKFHEKTLGLGNKDGYGRRKFSSEILK